MFRSPRNASELSAFTDVSSVSTDDGQQPPARVDLLPGDRLMLPCQIRGLPRPKTRWYRNDVELQPVTAIVSRSRSGSGATAVTAANRLQVHEDGLLEVVDVQPSDAGRYRCRVDAGTTSKYSNVTQLFVDTERCKSTFIR